MALEPGKFELNDVSHKQIVNNLIHRTKQLTPESVSQGGAWYKSGNQDAEYLSSQFGGGTLGASSAIAKLSASTDWNKNRMMGLQLPNIDDRSTKLIHRSAEIGKEMRSEGRSADEIKGATSALRRRAGLPGTPLSLQTSDNISAALKVRDDEVDHPLDIFKIKKNGSNKTPDFAMALATAGHHPAAVIDTHAYDAAMNSYHIPYGTGNTHLAKAGVYSFMQNAYADAHQKALKQKLVPEGTSLSDFQAMHWMHQINNKVQVNAKAARSANANITITGNLLRNNPEFDPANHGLAPISLRTAHLDAFREGANK